ncbi:MAG TPA: hypothetical protein VK550_20445, partial [Polyangiaceae bacterium]|nr:hypothetical protein [Polyangiaceae bacterium]
MRAQQKGSRHEPVATAAIVGSILALLAACSVYDTGLGEPRGSVDASVDKSGTSAGGHGGAGVGGSARDASSAADRGIGGEGGGAGMGGDTGTGGAAGMAGRGGASPPPVDAANETPIVPDASARDVEAGGVPPTVDAANPPTDIVSGADRKPDVGYEGGLGCGPTTLLPVSEDPSVRGPWMVGVRTAKIGRLTTEILYPAEPGSEQGKTEAFYDIRAWIPERERSKVPDANSPAIKPIGGNLFRDLPIDGGHGPYPIVVYIHGTSSFRMASLSTMAHWASRGFVVVSADYPGMFLYDMLAGTLACVLPTTGTQDVPGDVATQMLALATPT